MKRRGRPKEPRHPFSFPKFDLSLLGYDSEYLAYRRRLARRIQGRRPAQLTDDLLREIEEAVSQDLDECHKWRTGFSSDAEHEFIARHGREVIRYLSSLEKFRKRLRQEIETRPGRWPPLDKGDWYRPTVGPGRQYRSTGHVWKAHLEGKTSTKEIFPPRSSETYQRDIERAKKQIQKELAEAREEHLGPQVETISRALTRHLGKCEHCGLYRSAALKDREAALKKQDASVKLVAKIKRFLKRNPKLTFEEAYLHLATSRG